MRELSGLMLILYLSGGMGFTGVCICENLRNGTCKISILLYVNFTLKKESQANMEL